MSQILSRRALRIATLAAAFAVSCTATAAPSPAPATPISVLTYNIHGLPWPLAWGRSDDFGQIAARLRAMRQAGIQPHIVVLQEAFTRSAQRIGAESGYRYVVDGPAAADRSSLPATDADRRFAAAASWFKGERSGKLLGSGLQLLSDYPILAVRRAPFPAYACAGYDCLANKGILMALVAVPGAATPVVVTTAHFNSRGASGVSDERADYAYRRQLDAAGRFMAQSPWHRYPIIFAGDFNVGKIAPRARAFASATGGWWGNDRTGALDDAMHACSRSTSGLPRAALESFRRAKDWQLFASTRFAALTAEAISVPFGRGADGRMLSDHIGYVARYRLAPLAPTAARGPLGYVRLK